MTPNHPAWDSLRAAVVIASVAAGIEPPIGPVDPDFSSPERLEAETRHLKDMGYASRAVIHPAQVPPVHRGLAPTPEELDKARKLLATHEEALARGEGVGVDDEGNLIDEAFVRRARRIVDSADPSPE
jgi:citrate lyase subunit beta/citryl-CoA lyase